jgi:hypothetical protein
MSSLPHCHTTPQSTLQNMSCAYDTEVPDSISRPWNCRRILRIWTTLEGKLGAKASYAHAASQERTISR